MTVQTFSGQVPCLQISESALKHFKQWLAQAPTAIGICFGTSKTGCSGFAYETHLLLAQTEDEIAIPSPDGLPLFMKRASVPLLNGVKVDYIQQTLGQKKLVFDNPNAQGTCGCGESFSVN